MGKKFITLAVHSKRYKLYSDDIKSVSQKRIKKLPMLPSYPIDARPECSLPLHFSPNFKELTTGTNSQ